MFRDGIEHLLDFCQAPAVRARRVRRPVQARALARRDSLVDATARLLDRGGWEALTTNAVAEEAGASIGTVYQYFPSKEALLVALLDRHRARLEAAIDGAVARGAGDPMRTADAAVDAFAQVWREEPGYRAAWAAGQMASLLERTGAEWGDAFGARVALVVRAVAPHLSPREALVVAIAVVHLVSGLLLVAMTRPPKVEAALVEETKVALRAYLAARLRSTPPRAGAPARSPRGRGRRRG